MSDQFIFGISAANASLLSLLSIIQIVTTALFSRSILAQGSKKVAPPYRPNVAVILALRGPDPNLEQTLSALLDQDYDHYDVIVVVDHESDPVVSELKRFAKTNDRSNLKITTVRQHLDSCSLKCGALADAISHIDSSYEVLAFVDADATPYKSWLTDLIVPLEDPSVGVTTGNRWYAPTDHQLGSYVRYCWNAGSIAQMWLNKLVWAGSMAFRRELVSDGALLEAWRNAFSVDTTLTGFVKRRGLRVSFVSNAVFVNQEKIGLKRFRIWAQRQLVTAGCYRGGSLIIFAHAWILSVSQILALVLWWIAGSESPGSVASTQVIALSFYWLTAVAALLALDFSIVRVAKRNGVRLKPRGASYFPMLLPSLLVTHFVYPVLLVRARFLKRTHWRGIDYRLVGSNTVRMEKYEPYKACASKAEGESII
jgi:glycosyltransferase involved in cell wall biosynthesis